MSSEPSAIKLPGQPRPADQAAITQLRQELSETPDILFAVLVGSRADGSATVMSDWDIAIQWRGADALKRITRHELLRHQLAGVLDVSDQQVDLIDLVNTRLAMKALTAEEGVLLVANDELAWSKFLTRTWRELEDYYWERVYAA